MNCSPTIAIALLLLSLTAGMWLLYKTQKENLSVFFKVVGWFIIVVSIGSMVCCGVRCIFKCGKQKQECNQSEQGGMNTSDCKMERGKHMMGHRGMNRCIMLMKEEGECEAMGKGCCKEGKKGKEECEEHGKDTVVVKKG